LGAKRRNPTFIPGHETTLRNALVLASSSIVGIRACGAIPTYHIFKISGAVGRVGREAP
jgi:hypothetical protein